MAPSVDDGFELWHTTHRGRVRDLHAEARDSLEAAARHLADARSVLGEAQEQRCDMDCDACQTRQDHGHIGALLDEALRDLAAASALSRPRPT